MIARCVCVLDKPLVPGEGDDGTLSLTLIFGANEHGGGGGGGGGGGSATTVYVLQQDHTSAVAPKGKVLLHLSAAAEAGKTDRERIRSPLPPRPPPPFPEGLPYKWTK